ncbi:MAG: PD40 domain-containing protein [Elusimicrobia bacterium]|nr:PD40 domain-containing protein [Elusimicrobiota bacterium]
MTPIRPMGRRNYLALLASLASLALLAFSSEAQDFGKNRLLIRDYPYKIWETEHFLIHYYEENPLLLEECAKHLEGAWDRATKLLEAKPKKKLPFFLYTNHNEFEQTRIVDIGEGTGGVTEMFKERLLVFNNGSMAWLRHVIYHEFVHEVEFAVLNEGFWKSARLLKSILYPLWLMEGLAEYGAGKIDEPTDLMYANDSATSRQAPAFSLRDLHNFNHLKPNQITKAYKQGANIIEFIADEYGEDKLSRLLKSFKERFDSASVLLDVLGLDDERFDKNYREWLEEKYGEPAKRLDEPSLYGSRVSAPEYPIPVFNWSPVASPDGRAIFFIGIREGYPAIYEQEGGKKKKMLVGRNFHRLDWIALEDRNLSLSSDGRYLYFVGEKSLKEYLCRYDRKTGELETHFFKEFQALKSPVPDPADPNRVALAGMENGFFDLYSVDLAAGRIIERLTADPQDDDHPVFLPDGSGIIYSTENSLGPDERPDRDLMIWKKEGKVTERLTRGKRSEKTPAVSKDGRRVLFVSNEDGLWDLYELDRLENRVLRRTKIITAVFSPSYLGTDESAILLGSFRDGELHAYKASAASLRGDDATAMFIPEAKIAAAPIISPAVMSYKGRYRTSFGTDLFFPAFFFSTQGGFFALTYWQGSDMLGYHNVATNLVLNSGSGILDYSVGYSFTRFRPQFQFVFKGSHYRDPYLVSELGEELRKKENLQAFIASYPLDKYHRLDVGGSLVERYHTFPSDPSAITNLQDFRLIGQFVRDTTTAPYLVVTRGSRFSVGFKRALPSWEFDLDYLSRFAEWHQFIPLGSDGTIASRLAYSRSSGRTNEVFQLTGQGGVRGYPQEPAAAQKRGVLINNIELRLPVFPDLNYHMWYLFPDFYIKNIYLSLFSDQGARWDDRAGSFLREGKSKKKDDLFHAAGVGLKFNTFILETFPFFFSLEWAKRTTEKGGILYGSIFQYFTFK